MSLMIEPRLEISPVIPFLHSTKSSESLLFVRHGLDFLFSSVSLWYSLDDVNQNQEVERHSSQSVLEKVWWVEMSKLLPLAWYCLWFWIIYARYFVYHFTTDNQELNTLVIFQVEYISCSCGHLQIIQNLIQKFTAILLTSCSGLFSGLFQNPSLPLSKKELNLELLLAWRTFWSLSTYRLVRSWHLSSKSSPLLAPNLLLHNSLHKEYCLFPRTLRTFLIFLGKSH